MKSFVVSVLGFAAVAMAGTSAVNADTATFAVGEWAPYIGEALPDKGPHAKRVSDVFSGAGYDVKFEFTPWKRASESTKRGDLPATFSGAKQMIGKRIFCFPRSLSKFSRLTSISAKTNFRTVSTPSPIRI